MGNTEHPPSIKETAFECPHCGAFAAQHWYELFRRQFKKETPLPDIPNDEFKKRILNIPNLPEQFRESKLEWCDKMSLGLVFVKILSESQYLKVEVNNLYLSQCYNCDKISVWVHDRLVFPYKKFGIAPNQDLPDDIKRDFEEARDIVNLSPRGAAALLRLCVQKICIFLDEKGKNLDEDIANLVKKGLDPVIQESLDVVRVVGNQAVHPGELDLKDDSKTAIQLFKLINMIADQRITNPQNAKKLYNSLPEGKRKAIEERNKKAKKDKL
ncbi:MAG: DUF4145 domain-containing protein [Candidatus Zixiibacteriota bacterium]